MRTDEKLTQLRALMKEKAFYAYIIPSDDFHSSEYVGRYFKAREYMSGFTGSAGTLVVLPDKAALWTDGRYFLQAGEQLKGSTIELMRSGQPDVPKIEEYLYENLPDKAVIGFDGRTVTKRFLETIREKTDGKQITFDGSEDLVNRIWTDRPPLSKEQVWELDVKYAGRSRAQKIREVREKMQEEKADQLLVTALDEIAWLFNLRGGDIAYTPVFLSYLLLTKEQITLFVHREIFSAQLLEKLGQEGVTIRPYEEIGQAVGSMPAGTKVWLDSGAVNYRLTESVPETVEILDQESPIVLMKAVKSPEEMEHMRAAHVKDGVAVTRFIHWLKTSVSRGPVTEVGAARKLETFRSQMEGYLEPSFSDHRLWPSRCDRALCADAGIRCGDEGGELLSGGCGRPLSGRHYGYHPYHSAGGTDGRREAVLYGGAAGESDAERGKIRRRGKRTESGCSGENASVGDGHGLQPRNRPRGRLYSWRA